MELTKETLIDISKVTNLLTEENIKEILYNQKVVQDARVVLKKCPLGICQMCEGIRFVLGDTPY